MVGHVLSMPPAKLLFSRDSLMSPEQYMRSHAQRRSGEGEEYEDRKKRAATLNFFNTTASASGRRTFHLTHLLPPLPSWRLIPLIQRCACLRLRGARFERQKRAGPIYSRRPPLASRSSLRRFEALVDAERPSWRERLGDTSDNVTYELTTLATV